MREKLLLECLKRREFLEDRVMLTLSLRDTVSGYGLHLCSSVQWPLVGSFKYGNIPSCSIKRGYSLIILCTIGFSQRTLIHGVSKFRICPYTLDVLPIHSHLFLYPNNISWKLNITERLITQYSPAHSLVIPYWTKYFPQLPVPKHPNSFCLFTVSLHVLHLYYKVNYGFVYFNLYIFRKQTGERSFRTESWQDFPEFNQFLKYS
jgi:hypothetical protein